MAGNDVAQTAVSSGNNYVVPADGTITSWSTNTITGASQSMTFKVFRSVPNQPGFFTAVAHDGPRMNLAQGVVNVFAVNIPVQAGDLIGINGTNTNMINGTGTTASDTYLSKSPPGALADGVQGAFVSNTFGRLNLSAQFEPTPPATPPPSNNFTVAGTTLNKKNGTATLNFNLPAPGDLSATGPGVSAASAGWATISKAVGAGPATLVISAAGKQKKKLRQKGKVTLSVAVTYTPTGGTAKTQSVSVLLKLKKKKK